MRLKVIACRVFLRELYKLADRTENIIDITGLWRDLHDTPDILRKTIQSEIDRVEADGDRYDAIALCYGLCSNAVVGVSSKKYKLIVPRAHDCVTLLLGSKERYKTLFDSYGGGAYWYTRGWLEHSRMPSRGYYEVLLAEYTEKYGEDNAEFLVETELEWMRKYNSAVYVKWDEFDDGEQVERTKADAAGLDWNFAMEKGDSGLMERMLKGEWSDEEFLIVPPGGRIAASNDDRVLEGIA